MRLLRFFSRVAFLCNICYVLTSLARYGPTVLSNNDAISTIIVLGWLMSIVVNTLVNLWVLIAWAFRMKLQAVPRWLIIVNLIFFVIQLVIIILFTHDPQLS